MLHREIYSFARLLASGTTGNLIHLFFLRQRLKAEAAPDRAGAPITCTCWVTVRQGLSWPHSRRTRPQGEHWRSAGDDTVHPSTGRQ
ncbi:hypothetical protein ULF88_06030 [Halopseudomonas pachastrellae]|nr:hypothetical protein [Halopseudomonas pachastrellae]